jgi:hypothetical protein
MEKTFPRGYTWVYQNNIYDEVDEMYERLSTDFISKNLQEWHTTLSAFSALDGKIRTLVKIRNHQ